MMRFEPLKFNPSCGPWHVTQNSSGLQIVGATSRVVCSLKNCDREHRDSNALLIAAAPELLAELRSTLAALNKANDELGRCSDNSRAQDAIAKATTGAYDRA